MRTITTTWQYATYDVWGNSKDGYEVNDVYRRSEPIELELTVIVNNEGQAYEFESAHPSNKQICDVFGVKCRISTDGDDTTIYVTRDRDSYPIGELTCTSHDSLSPIRECATVK